MSAPISAEDISAIHYKDDFFLTGFIRHVYGKLFWPPSFFGSKNGDPQEERLFCHVRPWALKENRIRVGCSSLLSPLLSEQLLFLKTEDVNKTKPKKSVLLKSAACSRGAPLFTFLAAMSVVCTYGEKIADIRRHLFFCAGKILTEICSWHLFQLAHFNFLIFHNL